MSDDTESQVHKSVLSPHVAEFVPSSYKKKLEQNDVSSSQRVVLCEKPVRNVQEKDSNKLENDLQPVDNSKPSLTHEVQNEKRPILSWRQRDCEEDENSKVPIYRQRYNLNDQEGNWRSRHEETRDDYKPQSKKFTKDDQVDKTKRTVSFQSSLRFSSDQSKYDKSHEAQERRKSFQRGRGRARNAWTNDCGTRENISKRLDQDRTLSHGRGRGVLYSDTLKSMNEKTRNNFKTDIKEVIIKDELNNERLRTHEKGKSSGSLATDNIAVKWIKVDHKKKTSEFQAIAQNDVMLQDEGGKWVKDRKKKLQSKNIANNEHGSSKQENKRANISTIIAQTEEESINKELTGIKGKGMTHKLRIDDDEKTKDKAVLGQKIWKGRRENTQNAIHKVNGIEPQQCHNANSSIALNNPSEKKIISQDSDIRKDFSTRKFPTDLTLQAKTIKLLKKDDELPAERETFDLLHEEDEFPDLQSANSKHKEIPSLASDWLSGGSRMPIISYSAALKTIVMPRQSNKPTATEGESMLGEGNKGEETQAKTKKKKKKKKKKKDQDKPEHPPQQSTNKAKQPLEIDFGDWITTLDKPQPKNKVNKQTSKKVTAATGVLQIKLPSAVDTKAFQPSNSKLAATVNKGLHNVLDSTAPLVKRGKEREIPKKKKPSPLKKIILKEREEKKKLLDGTAQDANTTEENAEDERDEEGSPSQDDKDQQEDIATSSVNYAVDAETMEASEIPTDGDIKAQIHSRRFREYCDNVMDKELNKTTTELLQKLVVFQDRQYHKDPIKSKAKRRYVVGLREVTKHLKLKKIKLVIISPNVERIKSAGGLDDTLHNIITIAHQNGVPVVFALRRQILGRILHKKVPVSAVGVFNYDGAQDHFKELMDLTDKARAIYASRWKKAYDELMERIQKEKELVAQQANEQKEEMTFMHEDVHVNNPSSDDSESEHECDITSDLKGSLDSPSENVERYDSDEVASLCGEENELRVEADIDVEDL